MLVSVTANTINTAIPDFHVSKSMHLIIVRKSDYVRTILFVAFYTPQSLQQPYTWINLDIILK